MPDMPQKLQLVQYVPSIFGMPTHFASRRKRTNLQLLEALPSENVGEPVHIVETHEAVEFPFLSKH